MSSSAVVSSLLTPTFGRVQRSQIDRLHGAARPLAPQEVGKPGNVPTQWVRPSAGHEGWQPTRHRGLWLPALLLHLLLGAALWHWGPAPLRAARPEPVQVTLSAPVQPKPPAAAPRLAADLPHFQPVSVPHLEVPVVLLSTPAPAVVSESPAPQMTVQLTPPKSTVAPAVLRAALPAIQEGPRTVAASAVQFLQAPAVVVPAMSRRLGESGTVVLKVVVDVRGLPRQIVLHQSSGYSRLDEQALQAMRQARFKPYMENGEPQEMLVLTPIEYELVR